jgi:hypothetical protein
VRVCSRPHSRLGLLIGFVLVPGSGRCLPVKLGVRLSSAALLLDGLLELHVRLLLDSLGVLQLLDQLHLEQLHLDHFLLLVRDEALLLLNLPLDVHARLVHASAACLIDLLLGNLLLHLNVLLAHHVPLRHELHVLLMAHLVFLRLHLRLVRLLLSVHVDRRLDLLPLLFAFHALSRVGINELLLAVLLHLHAFDFIVHPLGVALLEAHDLAGALLGLLDLLPGAHLFLLEEGDAVGKQLGIALDAISYCNLRLRPLLTRYAPFWPRRRSCCPWRASFCRDCCGRSPGAASGASCHPKSGRRLPGAAG